MQIVKGSEEMVGSRFGFWNRDRECQPADSTMTIQVLQGHAGGSKSGSQFQQPGDLSSCIVTSVRWIVLGSHPSRISSMCFARPHR